MAILNAINVGFLTFIGLLACIAVASTVYIGVKAAIYQGLTTAFRPPSMYTPFVGLPFMRRPWRSKIPERFSVIYRLRMIRRTDPII